MLLKNVIRECHKHGIEYKISEYQSNRLVFTYGKETACCWPSKQNGKWETGTIFINHPSTDIMTDCFCDTICSTIKFFIWGMTGRGDGI